MIAYTELARRAQDRSEVPDDYWDRAARVLRQAATKKKPWMELTLGQWNWCSQLRAKLTEPWE